LYNDNELRSRGNENETNLSLEEQKPAMEYTKYLSIAKKRWQKK
jgi:hypothetical protein